ATVRSNAATVSAGSAYVSGTFGSWSPPTTGKGTTRVGSPVATASATAPRGTRWHSERAQWVGGGPASGRAPWTGEWRVERRMQMRSMVVALMLVVGCNESHSRFD